jgi:hypothetical protein
LHSATATAPTTNGRWMFHASTILPATNGARPPPMNRRNPYAADATGRSTGETSMTACVVSVLLIPRFAAGT